MPQPCPQGPQLCTTSFGCNAPLSGHNIPQRPATPAPPRQALPSCLVPLSGQFASMKYFSHARGFTWLRLWRAGGARGHAARTRETGRVLESWPRAAVLVRPRCDTRLAPSHSPAPSLGEITEGRTGPGAPRWNHRVRASLSGWDGLSPPRLYHGVSPRSSQESVSVSHLAASAMTPRGPY